MVEEHSCNASEKKEKVTHSPSRTQTASNRRPHKYPSIRGGAAPNEVDRARSANGRLGRQQTGDGHEGLRKRGGVSTQNLRNTFREAIKGVQTGNWLEGGRPVKTDGAGGGNDVDWGEQSPARIAARRTLTRKSQEKTGGKNIRLARGAGSRNAGEGRGHG